MPARAAGSGGGERRRRNLAPSLELLQAAADQEALFLVIKRYAPALEPANVGTTFAWLNAYGRKVTPRMVGRYFATTRPNC